MVVCECWCVVVVWWCSEVNKSVFHLSIFIASGGLGRIMSTYWRTGSVVSISTYSTSTYSFNLHVFNLHVLAIPTIPIHRWMFIWYPLTRARQNHF